MDQLASFLLITGIVINVIVLVLLCQKKEREQPSKILFALFVSFLFVLIFFYAINNRIKWLALISLVIEDPVIFIISPLLLIYVRSLFSDAKGLVWQHRWHFLPVVLYCLFFTLPMYYYFITKKYLFDYVKWVDEHDYIIPFQILFLLFYAGLALLSLNKHQERIKNYYSNIELWDISWIKKFLIGVLVVGVLDFSTTIYELIYGTLPWNTGILTALSLVVLVIYLAYYGLTQSQLLVPSFELGAKDDVLLTTSDKKEGNLEKANSIYKDKILLAFEEDKLHKDPELNLSKLANHVNSTDKKVSTIINQQIQTSFYELVNQYRVEEVKRMIDSKKFKHYTLQGIALEAGFKSKTSFYRVFRKHTGMTPSQYKSNK